MKHLLNTLYVTTEDAYASLDGENVVVKKKEHELGRYPLHILQGIYLFTYAGASPKLIGKCVEDGIDLVLFTPQGKFLARATGRSHGNVLLRRQQYRYADDPVKTAVIAGSFVFGKIYNGRQVINHFKRNHMLQVDSNKFDAICGYMKTILTEIGKQTDVDVIRGYEGTAARLYFGVFDDMVLQKKDVFYFMERNRRLPLDRVNALLSYVYTLCGTECASALEAAGLDSYVGFLHTDKPGRTSLAQDLLEELRPCMCDRFVIKLINDRCIKAEDFEEQANGAVLISAEGRRKVLKEWKERKETMVMHPYLKEKVEWGMIPYVQAILLARYIRGDIDGYPPFLYR